MVKQWLIKQRAKGELLKVFRTAEIGISHGSGDKKLFKYPKVNAVRFNYERKTLTYVFTVPTGVDPKLIQKKRYVFEQVFTKNIEIKGDLKTFTLTVFVTSFPDELTYNYEAMKLKGKLPIPVGMDTNGNFVSYDMTEFPHLLIAGETGSGKSTQLRSILVTLIQSKKSTELELYLGDLKRSEFHIFRNVQNVKKTAVSSDELSLILRYIRREITRRGDLLDEYELAHVDDLKPKLPYIIVAIDEVALLKGDKENMQILEEISAVGRALGIFLIMSMQRPDAKVLDGKLKVNLTVRMAFRSADGINSRIIVDKPGAEKLEGNGRMLLKIQSEKELKEIQAPYLTIEGAKKILEGYKSFVSENASKAKNKPDKDLSNFVVKDLVEVDDNVFGVLEE
ncbi:DNA translocase FtsK [Candidatus Microgenomates bacterium]|nr:MAG: DNA translocase FtsK [Candidatus Microgenomates bacterium]